MKEENLIVFYSHSQNTKKIAKAIQNQVGGKLLEINLKIPYPNKYNDLVSRVKSDKNSGSIPELDIKIKDFSNYKKIYIGTPNWWNSVAMPMEIFLKSNDFSNKTIIPFCTHGGGGKGNIFKEIKKLTNSLDYKEGLSIYGKGGPLVNNKLKKWLDKITN